MDQYFTHLYSYAHSSVLTFCHFNPLHCLYAHAPAGSNVTVHPSDFLGHLKNKQKKPGILMCPECQSPHPQQLELGRLLTEDETVLSLSMTILFTLALALYFETF